MICHVAVFVRCRSREQKSSSCFLESACNTGLSASSESQLCLPLFLFFFKLIEKSVPTRFLESLQKSQSVSLSPVRRVPAKLLSTQFCVCNGSEIAGGRPRSMHFALGCRFHDSSHVPSEHVDTHRFLRTNSLSSTASLTLPPLSLPPLLHLPPAVTAIAPMRAR